MIKTCGIIGAGKLAYSLCKALNSAGYEILGIISSNIKSAELLAAEMGDVFFSDKLSQFPADGDILFLTVPDAEIMKVADELAGLNTVHSDQLIVHCSGALDISVLNSLMLKGAATASFHIMQTFPSRRSLNINGSYVSIETHDAAASEALFELAVKLKLKPFRLDSKYKTAYHLSGVFASNFLIANIFSASEIFSEENLNTFEILEPIIQATLSNIRENGIAQSLSGPIDRGDFETVQKHMSIISDKELLLSYISQSYILLKAAEKKYNGLNENQRKIKILLDKAFSGIVGN